MGPLDRRLIDFCLSDIRSDIMSHRPSLTPLTLSLTHGCLSLSSLIRLFSVPPFLTLAPPPCWWGFDERLSFKFILLVNSTSKEKCRSKQPSTRPPCVCFIRPVLKVNWEWHGFSGCVWNSKWLSTPSYSRVQCLHGDTHAHTCIQKHTLQIQAIIWCDVIKA